jgi:hypothetical protein
MAGKLARRRLKTVERRQYVVALRTAGATFRQCADQAIAHFGAENLPRGYGPRYAFIDITAVLDKAYKEMNQDLRAYQQIQVSRYEGIIRTHWPAAMTGKDKGATEIVLKAMKDENKLLGLDSPQRVDIRVQQIDQRIERLMAELTSGPEGATAGQLGAGGSVEEDSVVEGTARHL